MNTHEQELLSAFVDGELQGDELDKALHLLATNDQALVLFQRYQYQSDVLHGYQSDIALDSLSIRLSAAISNEPDLNEKTDKKSTLIHFPKQFWLQASQFALAASVGAIIVLGVMPSQQDVAPQVMAAIEQAPVQLAASPNQGNDWLADESEIEDRLDDYLLDHNEYAGSSGVFSYARLVSY